jgi:hypothetical protein
VYKDSCFATSSPAFVVITLDYGHSFITREVELFFVYSLAICASSFENSLFNLRCEGREYKDVY